MSIASKNTVTTLQEFWKTLSGWNDIRQFVKVFFFILRKPFRNTIQVFKSIEPHDSYKFFVQSFVIFTIITSLFTAFVGNDILKSILQMLNQLFFLTLSTLLYFLLFNSFSKVKRSFSEFLNLYSLYMGFILPFFAVGSLLNWQIILTLTDPALATSAPDPFKFIPIFLGALALTGFGIVYSSRIIHYLWNIHYGLIILGMILVFILLTPLQRIWIQWQCKIGVTPQFEFSNPAHRKATMSILGCEDLSCKSCFLVGQWKWADRSIKKYEQDLINANKDQGTITAELDKRKSMVLIFEVDGRYTLRYNDIDQLLRQYSTPWFFSDDGKYLYFDDYGFQILHFSKDSASLQIERQNYQDGSISYDTVYMKPLHSKP